MQGKLIPRYNWDYGIGDLVKGIVSAFRPPECAEKKLAEVFGEVPLLMTSGRSALFAILKALELPSGAGVGVPLFCCPVVFEAIRFAGLTPIFIDIENDTYNMSHLDLGKKQNALSAVIVPHMFGHPANMDALGSVAENLPMIEDCAQALFSKRNGRYVGFSATASFFSFRSGKYISAGEGSAIFCRESRLHGKIAAFIASLEHWNTRQAILSCINTYIKSTCYREPLYGLMGYSIGRRLDMRLNLTAKSGIRLRRIAASNLGIIGSRISTFETNVFRQIQNARYLLSRIPADCVVLPKQESNCENNYFQFAVRFQTTTDRNNAAELLLRRGIDTAMYLDGIGHVAKTAFGYIGDCPVSESCASTILVIPHYYSLSQKQLERISEGIIAVTKRRG